MYYLHYHHYLHYLDMFWADVRRKAVKVSAALCADVGISRVHLNRRFMKTMRHKSRDWMTGS